MSDWPVVPSDNLYKSLAFGGAGIAVAAGALWVAKLAPDRQNVVLEYVTVSGIAICVIGTALWYFRTQRHIDRRDKSSPRAADADANVQAAASEQSVTWAMADERDTGLPAVPDPAIQNGFSIWPLRFIVDLRQKPKLTFALLGINFGDREVVISKVTLPYFYISATRSLDMRDEIARDGMLRIAPGQHFQFFVNKVLDSDRAKDFAALSRQAEYSASLTVEAHYRRGDRLFSYGISNLGISGIIEREGNEALSNGELGWVALSQGEQGTNVQRLIEGGEYDSLRDMLKKLQDEQVEGTRPFAVEVLELAQALDKVRPGFLKSLGWTQKEDVLVFIDPTRQNRQP